jgi:hypothetical protein
VSVPLNFTEVLDCGLHFYSYHAVYIVIEVKFTVRSHSTTSCLLLQWLIFLLIALLHSRRARSFMINIIIIVVIIVPFQRMRRRGQGTFKECSGSFQGTFRERLVNIRGAFNERSGNIQGTLTERSGNIRGKCSERSGNIRGLFGAHFGNAWCRYCSGSICRISKTPTSTSSTFRGRLVHIHRERLVHIQGTFTESQRRLPIRRA